jgi:hypothetical protein
MFDREFTAEVPDPSVPAATAGENPPAADDPAPADGGSPGAQPAEAAPAAKPAPSKTAEPAPAPAPVPAESAPAEPARPELPSPEERAALIRAAKRQIEREERELVRETGRPLEDPAVRAAESEGDEALGTLRDEYPEIYKAIIAATRPFVRRDDMEDFQESLREQVQAGTMSTATEVALTQVVAAHPDWSAVLDKNNPKRADLQAAVWKVVDDLPHKQAVTLEKALLEGSPAQAARAIAEIKSIAGVSDVAALLQGGGPQAGPAQPQAPAAPPQPAPVNQERMVAAQAIPGEGTHAPHIPARPAGLPLTDQDLDREFDKAWAEA